MSPSLFLKMLLLAAVAFLLTSLPSYEARKILQNPNQDQVPPTFVPAPNPLSQKALASDQINVSSLLGGLDCAPHIPVPPSAPSPRTYIPSSAMIQRKNPPHPSMLHDAYHASPPNLSIHIIPPSTTTYHNTAPLLGTPQMSPLPPSVNTASLPQKSPLPPFVSNRGTSIP